MGRVLPLPVSLSFLMSDIRFAAYQIRQFVEIDRLKTRVCKSFETMKFGHIYRCHYGDIFILSQPLMYSTAPLDKKKVPA